jgi:hypothetical protein
LGATRCYAIAFFQLIALEPETVKRLRKAEPHFGNMTADFVRDQLPPIPVELATLLCERR